MSKIKNIFVIITLFIITKTEVLADGGFLGPNGSKLRNGTVDLGDIPRMITYAIDFFMGIAATVSVIFIIVGAYKILFGSISQDKTKGRDTILMAIGGFIIASLAWFIIKLILDNFS